MEVLELISPDEALDWRTLALRISALLAQPSEPRADPLTEVAGQLRAPVATLRAHAARLMVEASGHADADATREVARHIVRQADLISGWVDAILDVQRLRLGKLELDPSRFDLAGLVGDRVREIGGQLVDEPAPLWLRGDRVRLGQAVTTLLRETRAAWGDEFTVRLTARAWPTPRGRATLLCSTSAAAPTPDLSRPPRAARSLSLYVARELVRVHGGELWADFEAGRVLLTLPPGARRVRSTLPPAA